MHDRCQLWLPDYARGLSRGVSHLAYVRHLRNCKECQDTLAGLLSATEGPPIQDEDTTSPELGLLMGQIELQPQEGRKADVVRSSRRVRRWAIVRPLWQYGLVIAASIGAVAHARRRK